MPNLKIVCGTKDVGKENGATILELIIAIDEHYGPGRLSNKAREYLFHLEKRCWANYKTNLALTGNPLNKYDLQRIAECE